VVGAKTRDRVPKQIPFPTNGRRAVRRKKRAGTATKRIVPC
jgi:hypothetical protein